MERLLKTPDDQRIEQLERVILSTSQSLETSQQRQIALEAQVTRRDQEARFARIAYQGAQAQVRSLTGANAQLREDLDAYRSTLGAQLPGQRLHITSCRIYRDVLAQQWQLRAPMLDFRQLGSWVDGEVAAWVVGRNGDEPIRRELVPSGSLDWQKFRYKNYHEIVLPIPVISDFDVKGVELRIAVTGRNGEQEIGRLCTWPSDDTPPLVSRQ